MAPTGSGGRERRDALDPSTQSDECALAEAAILL